MDTRHKSGVLMHITSLPGPYGIGDLGPGAYRFADTIAGAGQSFWQVLPINPTDGISEHSPYSSLSAFAGNPLLISPELLIEDGFLSEWDIPENFLFSDSKIGYPAVVDFKKSILDMAYSNFRNDKSVMEKFQTAFEQFCSDQKTWLDDFSLYLAIKQEYKGEIWTKWEEGLRKRDPEELSSFAERNRDDLFKIKFIQFLFFRQWDRLKTHCQRCGVHLIGDMAIYMNYDSADVWTHPENYKLDGQDQPVFVAGVPPDYFSATGQRWGNPVYDWDQLEKDGFRWWVERFRHAYRLFDIFRIDHFRGLVQYWEIPAGEPNAVNGEWTDVPTDGLLTTLEQNFQKPLKIIAEDLGHITDDVRKIMQTYRLPGMKVLLFAFNGNMKTHPYLPHNYKKNCVVYTGTHDNNTVLGWYQNEASDRERRNLERYLNTKLDDSTVVRCLIKAAEESPADLVLIPAQDVLGLGEEARMNRPGGMGGNWNWRCEEKYLQSSLWADFGSMTKKAGR